MAAKIPPSASWPRSGGLKYSNLKNLNDHFSSYIFIVPALFKESMQKIKLRKKHLLSLAAIALAVVVCSSALLYLYIKNRNGNNEILRSVRLPPRFKIDIFASNLEGSIIPYPGPNQGPRLMEFYNEVLFVSVPSGGKIFALPDRNKDGKADEKIEAMGNLDRPHGIAFYQDWMYVANEGEIIRVKINKDFRAVEESLEHIADLPSGSGHWTRTIRINKDNLYASIGSSCNLCIESYERRAAILKCSMAGNCSIYAQGLRNAVGLAFDPETWQLWGTENSRDFLGDNLPPDEINIISEGRNYGWPYCYGKNIPDPEFSKKCNAEEPSLIDLQAHSAPLGLAFNTGKNFHVKYLGDLFVAYHGSWNRKEKTGYKIVRINPGNNTVEDFAAGWLQEGKVLGRPVDIIFDNEGIMYVSDDFAGVIYRISMDRTGLI